MSKELNKYKESLKAAEAAAHRKMTIAMEKLPSRLPRMPKFA